MIRINRYLAHKNKEQTNIIFSICEGGKRVKVTSKLSIESKYWDSKKQRAKPSFFNSVYINKTLNKLQTFIESECAKHFEKYGRINFDSLKTSIKQYHEHGKKKDFTFLDLVDEFIEHSIKSSGIRDNTIRSYKSFKNNVFDFQSSRNDKVLLSDLNKDMILNFKVFLQENYDYKDGTLHQKLKIKNLVLNYAVEKKYLDSFDYRSVMVKNNKSTQIALTDSEVEKLIYYKPMRKQLIRTRYYFLFQLFSGIRISDLVKLTKEKIDLENGLIYLIAQKNDNEIKIPISRQMRAILEEFDVTQFKKSLIPSYTIALKELCKEAGIDKTVVVVSHKNNRKIEENKPKYELVGTHTARRTVITKLRLNNISDSEIIQVTGHSSTNSLKSYTRIDNAEAVSNVKNILDEM